MDRGKIFEEPFPKKAPVTLQVKPQQIGHGDDLLLTTTQIQSRDEQNTD